MIDKKRVIGGFLITLAVLSVIGMSIGGVSGQILAEQTYYSEDFSSYNDSSPDLKPRAELQNQHLTNTSQWNNGLNGQQGDGDINYHDFGYGEADTHRYANHLDTRQPWLQQELSGSSSTNNWDHYFGLRRDVSVPNSMSDPVLIIEYAYYKNTDSSNDGGSSRIVTEIAVDDQAYTTYAYDGGVGNTLRAPYGDGTEYDKIGNLARNKQDPWKTGTFDVSSTKSNVTVTFASSISRGSYNGIDEGFIAIRNMYWAEGGSSSHTASLEGFEAQPEDDSFGGPDPYNFQVVTKPTADGEETAIRSQGQTITREFSLDGISDAQSAYFVLNGESHSSDPVRYTIEAFGQEVTSGTIEPNSASEEAAELDLDTDDVTVVIESEGQYDINEVKFTTLEQTSAGDPLAKNSRPGGITLNAEEGYDRTLGVLISGLDLTTDTLLYIVMIAITVGFMVFSYTKSVRGQEMAQSLLFGAAIASIVVIGVVPTMNLATWVFTGGIERAPLANPALEAEPPTYYSTEFQDGTLNGWEYDNARGQGSVRPVSVGESFELQFSGTGSTAGIITHTEHISLGDSLSTGFVNVQGAAQSAGGYNSNPHEVTYNIRVYVTDDGELTEEDMLDPSTNYVEEGDSAQYLSNPVTNITAVDAVVNGENRDLSNDFTVVDADAGVVRYEGNSTLANNDSFSETLSNPTISYDTHRNSDQSESFSDLEPGDTIELSKTEDSEDIAAISEFARSFNGEAMSNEQMVTFDLDGEYVHTVLIVRSNRDDENPAGTLTAVRVGATTEGGSVE